MSMKAGVFGGAATRSSNLALWTMAGLGITIGLYSCRKWIKYSTGKLGVFAREENDNGIDRLPDDILCEIISRLRMDEGSRTSILARRWRNIWTMSMNPELIFTCVYSCDHDYVAYSDRRKFLKAIDECLQVHSGRHLEIFSVHCCFLNSHASCLVRWMETLARSDVGKIYLGNSCRACDGGLLDKPFTFSFKLIDGFSKLKYLDLMACRVETTFASYCNSLLTLSLRHIRLSSHQLSDILTFCPNLTSLVIRQSELPVNITISGPNLKLMALKLYACNNLQQIVISNINIRIIKINICSEVQITLYSVLNLEKLHLRTSGMNHNLEHAIMPQLKYLLLQPKYQVQGVTSNLKLFANVRILHLLTRGYPQWEVYEEVDLCNFASVLIACPLLMEFYLLVRGRDCKKPRMQLWPILVHKHLQRMELSGFSGTRNQLDFARFIAMSADVLQTLVLRSSWSGCKLACSGDDNHEEALYFEDVNDKDSKSIDPEGAKAYLKDEFISARANLTFVL